MDKKTELETTLEKNIKLCEEDLSKLVGTIKHIPFNMFAKSNGIVNFNGNSYGMKNTIYAIKEGKSEASKNWQFPKLENPPLCNINEEYLNFYNKDENEKSDSFKDSYILVSSNCFKNAMYNQETVGLNNIEDAKVWLTTSKGLLNGFVLAQSNNNAHRTSPIYLSDLYTSFIKTDKDFKQLIDFDISEDHKEKNGKVKPEPRLQDTNQSGVGYTWQMNSVLKSIFYKSEGVIDLERLQFINIGGELGRDNVSNITEKNIEELKNTLLLFLNNIRKNLLNSNYLTHGNFYNFLEHIKQEENEIELEVGCFRKLGDISQLENNALSESGILLNKTALVVLILQYFNLMLKTVILKNHAKLETLFVEVNLPKIEQIPILFEKTFDFKTKEKEEKKKDKKDKK